MSSSKNNITPTNQTSLNDQTFSNDKALFNNQTIVVQVSMEKPSRPRLPSKVAEVFDSYESKEFEGNNPTPELTTDEIEKTQASLNDKPAYSGQAPIDGRTFADHVSMDKSSYLSQPSKVAQFPEVLSSMEYGGNNPSPDLTTENIQILQSTLDYGIQRWMSQKKKEDGVTVYDT